MHFFEKDELLSIRQEISNIMQPDEMFTDDLKSWIINNTLDLFDLNLYQLPKLPDSLHILRCDKNNLKRLPSLPNELTTLNCSLNQIGELPALPTSLVTLDCADNKLIHLPDLPSNIEFLFCGNNRLIKLPYLPPSLIFMFCEENPYLYISKELATRYIHLTETPNYPDIMNKLKTIYSANKRKKQLIFCEQLQIQIDEFRYRPNNAGYRELLLNNKNKFIIN